MMTSRIAKSAAGIGLAAALVASLAAPAAAAPLGAAGLGLASAAPAQVEEVRCRGCWVGAGVAAGVLTGAAIAATARPYYYEPAPPPVVYEPAPAYVYAPPPRAYAYGRCWVQTGPYRGQGFYERC